MPTHNLTPSHSNRQVHKRYVALSSGCATLPHNNTYALVDAAIGRHPHEKYAC